MSNTDFFGLIRNLSALGLVALSISGCLIEEEEPTSSDEVAVENRLSGSVGDGPIVGATLRVFRNDGEELLQFESNASAGYTISISTKPQYYPLSIDSSGGIDLVTNLPPDFDLSGAAIRAGDQNVANINPFSTFAVRLAEELTGGLTSENIELAQEIVSEQLNSGLGPLATSGPMITHIDEKNIAEIVKASETLAETVRRTRDLLSNAGFPTNGDAVIAALASDLTDELIDGRGGAEADARVAAVTTLVYSQVLLESMANELHVNGINAADAMGQVINQISVRAPTTTIDELTVTSQMVIKARTGLAAAIALDGTPEISNLHAIVTGFQAGMTPSLVKSLLPSDYRDIMQSTLIAVASADAAAIETVNDIARGTGDPEIGNQAPTIQGKPATSVEAGTAYSFSPEVADADNDALILSAVNVPAWAGFDSSTGQLTGTPTAADVGVYPNITISVSDGELTDSLPPFSIDVFEGNAPPTISGSPATSVVAGQGYVFAPSATDPNGDTLSFSISGKPSWADFNASTGRLSGAPFAGDAGTYANIIISVSDGQLSDSLAAFSIAVESANPPPNQPPTILGNPAEEVAVDSSYSFTPTAADPDGDNLTFSISNRPSWSSFSTSTGALTGTPGPGDAGVFSNIRITVSDGTDTASIEFSITVNAISTGSVTLNWVAPTENEDGTSLTDLAGYRILWGKDPGNYTNAVTIDNPGLTSYVVENLAPGTYEFVATSFNLSGVESVHSNSATKTVQ